MKCKFYVFFKIIWLFSIQDCKDVWVTDNGSVCFYYSFKQSNNGETSGETLVWVKPQLCPNREKCGSVNVRKILIFSYSSIQLYSIYMLYFLTFFSFKFTVATDWCVPGWSGGCVELFDDGDWLVLLPN